MVSLPQIFEGNVTKSAPHKAVKLISAGLESVPLIDGAISAAFCPFIIWP